MTKSEWAAMRGDETPQPMRTAIAVATGLPVACLLMWSFVALAPLALFNEMTGRTGDGKRWGR